MEYLMKSSESLLKKTGWNVDIPIKKWKYIYIDDGIIQEINLSGLDINDEDIKGLVLPPNLKGLYLNETMIGDDGIKDLKLPIGLKELEISECKIGNGIKKLIIPDGLEILHLDGNNIGDEGIKGLKLPNSIQTLLLENNNIGNNGIKGLILPFKLKHLLLSHNNFGNDGVTGMILPPGLKELELQNYNIVSDDIKGLILPPGLRTLYLKSYFNIDLTHIKQDCILIQSKTDEGKKRYSPIKRLYDKIASKSFQMEICRGLLYGETKDPIFSFLKKIHGSKNIRENILTYYNPFSEY